MLFCQKTDFIGDSHGRQLQTPYDKLTHRSIKLDIHHKGNETAITLCCIIYIYVPNMVLYTQPFSIRTLCLAACLLTFKTL